MPRREPEKKLVLRLLALIDPNASDSGFMTITDHSYLYCPRIDDNGGFDASAVFPQRGKLDRLAALNPKAKG